MKELFRITTDRVLAVWSDPGEAPPSPVPGTSAHGGVRVVQRHRDPGVVALHIAGLPDPDAPLQLFEQRDYELHVQARDPAHAIAIVHRDPNVTRGFSSIDGGRIRFGRINFGGQIGRTSFTVLVNGQPELDFELEVFPVKLDYAIDFEDLVSGVQRAATGLAFEYLRATYQLGLAFSVARPTELEWILLLRRSLDELERALRFIATQPVRGLTREPRLVHAARVQRVDAAIRSGVIRGRGHGPFVGAALPVRTQLEAQAARPTLDTAEHRWLAARIRRARRRVGDLLRAELARPPTPRSLQITGELEQLEARLAALVKLEPLAAASAPPPPGFASLQLIGAPGYREAYRQCLVLDLGLRIEGGPFRLSTKDLGDLYEYWCYLTVLQIVAEETGSPIPVRELVTIRRGGLRVLLEKGRATRVPFAHGDGRQIIVTYNPQFRGGDMLIAQQPDILITFVQRDWPAMHLVIDAKYRIDASPQYLADNDVPGPPQDALNVLHRYRDAILDDQAGGHGDRLGGDGGGGSAGAAGVDAGGVDGEHRPRRSVIQAIALFPGTTDPEVLKASRLWRPIERLGIGAIPALPERTELLREWLRSALSRGGWALADRAPRHAATERSHDWRRDASRVALIGVLRKAAAEHFAWITEHRQYYLRELDAQPRQRRVAQVAFYRPASLSPDGGAGAITHFAEVESMQLVRRDKIETPWRATDATETQVLYTLGPIQRLAHPVHNGTAPRSAASVDADPPWMTEPPASTDAAVTRGSRVSDHRWSSVLALHRARELRELLLETEPEWRLLETLRVRRITFTLRPDPPGPLNPENPVGRAWFQAATREIRYAGASGFLLRELGQRTTRLASLDDACGFLAGAPA